MQSDWVGLGWTLDTVEIVRKVNPDWSTGSGSPAWCSEWYYYANEFTLLYQGTSYKLVAATSNPYGRYHSEDEQFLYIERRNPLGGDSSAPNQTKEYWIVRLRDGTEYRLGYNADAEQTVTTNTYADDPSHTCHWSGGSPPTSTQCYVGHAMRKVAFRWRVDKVQDVHGNVIEFAYYETGEGSNPCGGYRERSSYLSEVRYNKLSDGQWGTRITFVRAGRNTDGVGDYLSPTDCASCRPFYQDDFLQKIRVENRDRAQYSIVREYLLAYNADPAPVGHDNNTRRLISITEYGTGGVAANHALPATTFSYTVYMNKGWDCGANCGGDPWNSEAFRYERLTNINNGYGGAIGLSYDKAWGESDQAYALAHNYHVTEKAVSDGQSGGYKLSYAYPTAATDRCYDNNSNCACDSPTSDGGSLVGFRYATETLKTTANLTVAIHGHEFHLNDESNPHRRLGREWKVLYQDAAGTTQKLVTTTWTVVSNCNGVAGTYFVYAEWVHETLREGGVLPSSPHKTTHYEYETSRQGGAQYGNLTKQQELQGGENGTVYRQTLHYFSPNITNTWIVGRPNTTSIYSSTSTSTNALQSVIRYIYDYITTTWDTPPVRGDVALISRTTAVTPNIVWVTQEATTYTNAAGYYLPIKQADGNGNETQTSYDALWKMYPLTVTNVLSPSNPSANLTTTYQYSYTLGQVTRVTGPNGSSTAISYEYDYWGRLTKVIRPGDSSAYPTVLYDYCDTCSPLRIAIKELITSGQSSTLPTVRIYNGLGQLIQEHQGTTDCLEMTVTDWTYNAQGLPDEVYVPYVTSFTWELVPLDTNWPKTRYAYDALGRSTVVTNPDGSAVRTDYSSYHKLVLDENNHQKVYEHDVFGRLVRVKEYSGTYGSPNWYATIYATTTYGYAPLDWLVRVTDTLGNTTVITYDGLGRKTAMRDPDMGDWRYAYDNAGNLISQTNALSQTILFAYDRLNRLTSKRYPSGLGMTVTYSYDQGDLGKGYRTGMSDGSGNTAWVYDARGRLVTETKVISGTGGGTFKTQWSYNPRDLVATQIYPGGNGGQAGEKVTTGYDKWGRPSALSGSSSYVISTTYDALGRLDWVSFGNGQQTDYVYYTPTVNGGRLYQVKTGTAGALTSTQYLQYNYDAAGNVYSIQDYNNSGQVQSFRYDELDRLISASAMGGADSYVTRTYAYSPTGCITVFEGVTYAYQDPAHKHAVTHVSGAQKYWYDANGNPITRTTGGGTYTLIYNAENRLQQVKRNGVVSATFAYDGDGKRVMGVVTAGTTSSIGYVGDWYEWSGSGTSYYHFAGRKVAMRTSSGVIYIHADHLGSALNTTGYITSSQRYYAYGATRGISVVVTPYRFTGQREESTIGLYFYNARWYDTALGRFVQPDTIVPKSGNPQALNRYSYVLNNPLKYIAPSGRAYEQSAGYTFDPNYWRDLLLWLIREANRNARLPEVRFIRLNNTMGNSSSLGAGSKAVAGGVFIEMVKDRAPWDFKDAIEKDLDKRIRLGDEWFEYSTPGNIHYGFVGAAAGFSLTELRIGAGVAQVRDYLFERGPIGTWKTGYDTEDDYYAVEFGYQLYQQAYAPDKKLTVSEFHALLVQYEHLNMMARRSEPIWPGEPDVNWPYQPGYFNGPSPPWPSFLFPSFH